ncbi:YccF domain-containing protein [Phenylobacterium sp.]|uniref:YccF domain-containing protein n=1 Tax=Phenylobacterium sp. TaxID=1871053 RepID=UPI0025CF3AE4|nr:YccF domain-containing protein [Phenylobacterium sp.]
MRLLMNVLWFILGGWISGTAWILAGLLLAITIVGLPWTPAAFRIAGFTYFPFGKVVVERDGGATSVLLNILWLLLAGWWLALHHLVLAAALAVTIIGIPFAWQHVKLAILSLTPVGKGVVEA